MPGYDGRWTPSAVAYVRVVARLRARGHTLEQIKRASDNGQLAIGPIENLLSASGRAHSLRDVARESGLPAELIRQIYTTMGLGPLPPERLSDEDLEMMRYAAAVLAAGFPLPAYLQLLRVYGQAIAQIADAEVRLMHLYVHEPLMRAGVPNVEIAEEMEGMTREVLPFASPFISYLHARLLSHFVEQDMIGHMEADLGEEELEEGRLRVAIAFADLAGYARLTVEQGDEAAVSTVERFVEAVEQTLPADARVIKTLGDEVMVVGSDPAALTAWAVGPAARHRRRRALAADRHPLRRGALPRRRLLRPRRQPGRPRGRARRWRRGARHAARRRARGRHRRAAVRPHRRGPPEGLLRAHRAVHRGRPRGVTAIEPAAVRETVRASGLFARDRPLVAMLSGGRDSTCLLDVAVALLGAAAVCALHVNYGLREEADAEERHCRALCDSLGVELQVVAAAGAGAGGPPGEGEPGNLQAWAREVRYARGRAPGRASATR